VGCKGGAEIAVQIQSGAARELGLVQIVVEALAIRGCFPNTQLTQPVFGWCCSQRFGGL